MRVFENHDAPIILSNNDTKQHNAEIQADFLKLQADS